MSSLNACRLWPPYNAIIRDSIKCHIYIYIYENISVAILAQVRTWCARWAALWNWNFRRLFPPPRFLHIVLMRAARAPARPLPPCSRHAASPGRPPEAAAAFGLLEAAFVLTNFALMRAKTFTNVPVTIFLADLLFTNSNACAACALRSADFPPLCMPAVKVARRPRRSAKLLGRSSDPVSTASDLRPRIEKKSAPLATCTLITEKAPPCAKFVSFAETGLPVVRGVLPRIEKESETTEPCMTVTELTPSNLMSERVAESAWPSAHVAPPLVEKDFVPIAACLAPPAGGVRLCVEKDYVDPCIMPTEKPPPCIKEDADVPPDPYRDADTKQLPDKICEMAVKLSAQLTTKICENSNASILSFVTKYFDRSYEATANAKTESDRAFATIRAELSSLQLDLLALKGPHAGAVSPACLSAPAPACGGGGGIDDTVLHDRHFGDVSDVEGSLDDLNGEINEFAKYFTHGSDDDDSVHASDADDDDSFLRTYPYILLAGLSTLALNGRSARVLGDPVLGRLPICLTFNQKCISVKIENVTAYTFVAGDVCDACGTSINLHDFPPCACRHPSDAPAALL